MQTFTRFYVNLVDCGLISDFRFLFNEDDFAISNLISVISARAYEISPSVGPLGLSYLHGRRPAAVHRDLSSNNVLLSKGHLVAKISDLGTAKMIRADSKQTKSRLTTAPGTLHFMPRRL